MQHARVGPQQQPVAGGDGGLARQPRHQRRRADTAMHQGIGAELLRHLDRERERVVRRLADKGCHAVVFNDNPTKRGLPSVHSDHWEPLWKAVTDCDTLSLMRSAPVEPPVTSTVGFRRSRPKNA